MPGQRRAKPKARIPLRLALTVPLALYAVLVGGLVAFFCFRSGEKAVDGVTSQLRSEIGARIKEHLRGFLDTPHHINLINEATIREGGVDAHSPDALAARFRDQVRAFDAVSSIYFGNAAGGLIDSGREGAGGEPYVIATDDFARGTFRKYATDDEGNRTRLVATVPDFDARTRPWYHNAVASGGAAWSDVYVLFTGQDMALAASRPVYDAEHRLLGVVSVDVFLSQLSDFLGQLRIGRTGHGFIIDRSGLLIASSTGEKPFAKPDGEAARRLSASESASPLVRGAIAALERQFGSCRAIAGREQLSCEIDGQRQFLQVLPVRSAYGIDWLIVTAIPETDFMAQVRADHRTATWLILGALAIAGLLGFLAARWLARPILDLNAAVRGLARGTWPDTASHAHGIAEIGELELSFGHMAEELRQTMGSLEESEERLGLALAGADLGTWDWNVQTEEVVFDERWKSMLGYFRDDIESSFSGWKRLLHPDDEATVMAVLTDHLEGRTPSYQVEQRLRAKSGEWRWILATGKVIVRDKEGKPLRAAGIHRDVTMQKQMEGQLVRQERLAAVGQLASGIAHDFNNILGAIMGYADLLRAAPGMSGPMKADLVEIRAASERGARLVGQVLDFCQKSLRQPERIDLGALVRQCVDELRPSLPTAVRIRVDDPPDGCLIEVDPSQLRQVLANLVANARDAMADGGELRLRLSRVTDVGDTRCAVCHRAIEGEWLKLEVTDNGVGISADILPRIFEPFFTTKEVGEGIGLGLSQAAGIMERDGAHMAVASKAGRGTTVACYFAPFGAGAKHPAGAETTTEPRCLVLVVGSRPDEAKAVAEVLDRLDYGVLAAPDGTEALRLLDAYGDRIAAVVSETETPDMDSPTLLARLRAKGAGLRMVVVGNVRSGGEHEHESDTVSWLEKPVTTDALLRRLRTILPPANGRWD